VNLQQELRRWALASAGVFCLVSIGYRVLTLPKLPDLGPTVSHIDAATGAWSAASKQQMDSISAIERDLRVELWHVDRVLTAGSDTLSAARGAIDTLQVQETHVAPLLDSLRASSDAIPPALRRVTDDADGIRPLLANADGGITDFRRFITAPALTDTLGNAASMTGSWAAVSVDARKVADKETADFLKPVRWYMKPVKRAGEIIDITAAVARHAP
jgi:hypothetical protein